MITRVRLIVDLDVNAKPQKAPAIARGILTRSGFRVVSSEVVSRDAELRAALRDAGDRRDWDECDRIEEELDECRSYDRGEEGGS